MLLTGLISEAVTNWITCRRHDLDPEIDLSVSPSFGWSTAKNLHPSEWSIQWSNFSLLLQESSPVENYKFSKQQTADQPRYFAFEKTSRVL